MTLAPKQNPRCPRVAVLHEPHRNAPVATEVPLRALVVGKQGELGASAAAPARTGSAARAPGSGALRAAAVTV